MSDLMRRRISIFGSTGSIGQSTVSLLKHQGGKKAYEVVALTGASNIGLLARQARELGAKVAVTARADLHDALKRELEGSGVSAAAGPAALLEAAAMPVDWTMLAIVGAAGLAPGLEAARHGTTLALANKESLVCAGSMFLNACRQSGARLLPVDSEHSAIHQAMTGETTAHLERVVLTASGGPFRDMPLEQMADVTREQARAHPNWDMGERISIDSATMFNKALEVIEAKVLFDLDPGQIEVIVHPQSIIHSMVGFTDGSIMAQLGPPDMRGAIGYALNWPERRGLPVQRLDFGLLARLDFQPVDHDRFPAIGLAYAAASLGGLAGAVFNAAKEVALDGFIAQRIGFLDMARLVAHVFDDMSGEAARYGTGYGLDDVNGTDSEARARARLWIENNSRV